MKKSLVDTLHPCVLNRQCFVCAGVADAKQSGSGISTLSALSRQIPALHYTRLLLGYMISDEVG